MHLIIRAGYSWVQQRHLSIEDSCYPMQHSLRCIIRRRLKGKLQQDGNHEQKTSVSLESSRSRSQSSQREGIILLAWDLGLKDIVVRWRWFPIGHTGIKWIYPICYHHPDDHWRLTWCLQKFNSCKASHTRRSSNSDCVTWMEDTPPIRDKLLCSLSASACPPKKCVAVAIQ